MYKTSENETLEERSEKKKDTEPSPGKSNKKRKPYFFKEDYINESNAFIKYFQAIKKNGFIENIIEEVENMGDFCDLFRDVSKDYLNEQINVFYESIPVSERNNYILYASDLLTLQDSPDKGRQLVANRMIPKDKVVINEYPTILQVRPLCNCVGDAQTSLYRCHNCGTACRLFYTCEGCNVCVFCSRSCLSLAYKNYHRYECYGLQRHFWPLEDTDYSYLAFRMMLYGSINNFETEPEPFKYGNFENNYPFIYQMETNFDQLSLPKLNEILYSSTRNLIYLIIKTTFFDQFRKRFNNLEDLYLYVGGLMVKHHCQAQVNNILLNYPNLAVGYGLNVTSGIGKAICPTTALLSHSCSPNATILICSDFLVVKSVRPIKQGEEITICYTEVNALLSVEERQLITEQLFDFTCQCSFCEFERNMIEAPYKCPICLTGNAKEIDPEDDERRAVCFKCEEIFSLETHYQTFKVISICRNLYNETYAVDHLTRIAECYGVLFPNNSVYMLDVYRILHEKHVHWGDQPLEAMKYGLLVFNIIEQNIPRLYVPLLVSKVNFMNVIVEMRKFSKIKKVSDEEYETIKIFVNEVVRVKNDLLFYLPQERLDFFSRIQLKVYPMFQDVKGAISGQNEKSASVKEQS